MKPIRYLIHVEPNLEQFSFKGFTTIWIESAEPTKEIILNAKELSIIEITAGTDPDNQEKCEFKIFEASETLKISSPRQLHGKFTLHITFEGIINDKLTGFYRGKYFVDNDARYMATTLFFERYARTVFPCFDHPAEKAIFDVEFLIDAHLQAISNTAIRDEKSHGDGKKLVRFESTPPMSTYLLYFGIGEFEFIEDTIKNPTIRVATTPGKTQFCQFALDWGRKSINFLEKFTGVKYPLSKCDYIGVTDFLYGAMENFGAITYRESKLFIHPEKTSKPLLVGIGSVIAHETAHMWFGDMVSPLEWKYLWLNESFATYFTYAIPHTYHPEWNRWDSFIQMAYKGLQRDGFKFTVPIELPINDSEASITYSTAPIIYNKGAAIIRILEGYLGPNKLQIGIRRFLESFKFKAASSNDFWETFEDATGEPIEEFSNSWVHQAGFQLITVTKKENTLFLVQNRYTYLENTDKTLWFIPIKILLVKTDGSVEYKDVIFKERELVFDIPENVIICKLNADQTGFYRVNYEKQMWEKLGEFIRNKTLNAVDRFGLIDDFSAMVKNGIFDLSDYLEFLEKYCDVEEGYLAVDSICDFLYEMYLLNEKRRNQVKGVGQKIFSYALHTFGMEPQENDSVQIAELRNKLLWLAYQFELASVKEFGENKFRKYQDGTAIHPDILKAILAIGALSNLAIVDKYKQQVQDPQVPEHIKQSILYAMGQFSDETIIKDILKWNMEEVPKRNRLFILWKASRNLNTKEWFWDYYQKNFPIFVQEMPKLNVENSLVTIVPFVGFKKPDEVNRFFEKIIKMMPKVKNTVRMAKEQVEIYAKYASM
jgi:aminopeptidase N